MVWFPLCPHDRNFLSVISYLIFLKNQRSILNGTPLITGKDYWQRVFNFQAMADAGMISQADVDGICYTDSVDEVYTS